MYLCAENQATTGQPGDIGSAPWLPQPLRHMIKNLIFDFGQVLVHHNPQPLFHRIFGDDEASIAELRRILSEPEFLDPCDRGTIPFEKVIDDTIKRHPEYEDALTFFRNNELEEITGEIEGMRDLLTRLKQEGYRLYGLSNWSNAVYPVIEKYEVFRLLDGMVVSCEEHAVKPEPEIYLRLCDKFSLKPEECLFTDDRPANVEGARRVDMQAVLFTSAEQYASDLEHFRQA